MANVKISDLPAASTPLTGTELVPIVQSGVTSQTTVSEFVNDAIKTIAAFLPAGTSAVPTTVQAKLRETVSVKDFGAVGDGLANDTNAIQKAIDSGYPLDFMNLTYKHTGLTLTSSGNVWWFGKGATLNYTGTSIGVKVQTINNSNAANFHMNGITFLGGANAFTITGQGSGIYSNIKISECEFGNTTSSALQVYQADGVQVIDSKAYNGGDNGFYLAHIKNAIVSNNIVRNSKGSAGIAVGYVNAYVASQNIDVIGNIVYCDNSATSGNYIGGIEVVYANNVKVTSNVIANMQTTMTVNTSIRAGIIVDEHAISDVDISNNMIYCPFQYGMFAGNDSTADIRRLTVKNNKFYNCGLLGAWFQRCNEGLEIVGNTFDTIQQHGVWLTSTCYDSLVANNTFRDIGIQTIYSTFNGVTCDGENYRVIDNTFYVGMDALTVTSTQLTPTYSVDPSTTTLSLYAGAAIIGVSITGTAGQFSCSATSLSVGQHVTISGVFGGTGSITGYTNPSTYYIIATNGTTTFTLSNTPGGFAITTTAGTPTGVTYIGTVLQASYNYSGKTYSDVATWINAQTNWSAGSTRSILYSKSASNLRRTGPRNTGSVYQYAVTGVTKITSAEPQYLVAANGTEGVIMGNKWDTYAIESGFGFDGANNMYSIGSDVLTDTNSYGARQFQFSNGTPSSLPYRYWLKGDRIQNSVPTAGQPKAWICTTAGKYTAATFTSEGNL